MTGIFAFDSRFYWCLIKSFIWIEICTITGPPSWEESTKTQMMLKQKGKWGTEIHCKRNKVGNFPSGAHGWWRVFPQQLLVGFAPSLCPPHALTLHPCGLCIWQGVLGNAAPGPPRAAQLLRLWRCSKILKGSQVFLYAMGVCPFSSGTIPRAMQLL